MKKTSAAIISIAVVIFATGVVFAQAQTPKQMQKDKPKENIFKELNLTPEQQKKLEENRKAARQEMMSLRTALREEENKLREELKNTQATRASVEPIASRIKSIQAQLIDHRINGIFAVKEILTPEQFAKFSQVTQKQQADKSERFRAWQKKKEAGAQ